MLVPKKGLILVRGHFAKGHLKDHRIEVTFKMSSVVKERALPLHGTTSVRRKVMIE